jgi:acetyl-CoA decarbonylase/synthase complex subunit gamma
MTHKKQAREKKPAAGPLISLPVVEVRTGPQPADSSLRKEETVETDSKWTLRDRLGAWGVRWGIRRNNYRVRPGLYSLGSPDRRSPVLVSANYKLSFDYLRRAMSGRKAWILVLDSDGVNVWCAAGKGTFGTEELASRIEKTGLKTVVDHRRLVVPQLGAVGIAAHLIRKHTGFRVIFGPVRAGDLPGFLDNGMKADPAMRKVTFTFRERLVLVPMELVPALRTAVPVLAALFLCGGFGRQGFSSQAMLDNGLNSAAALGGALLAGAVVTPLLLPCLPGRSFSFKGLLPGIAWASLFAWHAAVPRSPEVNHLSAAAWVLAIPALSSFLALNFTGSTTFTSLSGVKKEMRYAVPLQIGAAAGGLLLWIAGLVLPGAA